MICMFKQLKAASDLLTGKMVLEPLKHSMGMVMQISFYTANGQLPEHQGLALDWFVELFWKYQMHSLYGIIVVALLSTSRNEPTREPSKHGCHSNMTNTACFPFVFITTLQVNNHGYFTPLNSDVAHAIPVAQTHTD